MTFAELNAGLMTQINLDYPEAYAQITAQNPDDQVPTEVLDYIKNLYPDSFTKVNDSNTGRDTLLAPGEQLIQEGYNDSPDMVKVVDDEGGYSIHPLPYARGGKVGPESDSREIMAANRDQEVMELTTNQPDGIFSYAVTFDGDDEPQLIKRREKATAEELAKINEALADYGRSRGQNFTGYELRDVSDEMPKVLDYLVTSGKLTEDVTANDESLKAMAAVYPSYFKKLAMEEDPISLSGGLAMTGDALSSGLRSLKGAMMGGDRDDVYANIARQDVKPGSGLMSSLGQGMANSPLTIPSLALGGAPSLRALAVQSPWKALAAEAGIGAGEALAESGYRNLAGVNRNSASDMAQDAAIGLGFGGLGGIPLKQLGGLGTKNLTQAAGDAMSTKLGELSMLGDFARGRAAGVGTPEAIAKAQAKELFKSVRPSEAYDNVKRGELSKILGVKPGELFPALGLKNRHSELGSNITSLANQDPRFFQKWEQSYEDIVGQLDKRLGFSTAPSSTEAGDMISSSFAEINDEVFTRNNNSYSKILSDDTRAFEIGQRLQNPNTISELIGRVDDEIARLKKLVPTVKKEVPVEPTTDILDQFGNPYTGTKNVTKSLDEVNPNVAAASSSGMASLKGLKEYLQNIGNKDPEQIARDLNAFRDGAQRELKTLDITERAGEKDRIQRAIRDITAEYLVDATKKADPELGKALEQTNNNLKNYFVETDKLSKIIKDGTKDGKTVFNAVYDSPTNMNTYRNLMATYGPENSQTLEKLRQAYNKNKIIKYASTGEVSDKQMEILKPTGRMANNEGLLNPKDTKDVQLLADALRTLGSPIRQGLGSDIKSIQGKMAFANAMGSISGFKKWAGENIGLGSADAKARQQKKALADNVFGMQQKSLAYGDLSNQIDVPNTRAARVGQVVGDVGSRGSMALRNLANVQGNNLFLENPEDFQSAGNTYAAEAAKRASPYQQRLIRLRNLNR